MSDKWDTSDALDQLLSTANRIEVAKSKLSGSRHDQDLEPDEASRACTLARIEVALDQLDAGTYGICQSCGQNIAARRLVDDPLTRHCGCRDQ